MDKRTDTLTRLRTVVNRHQGSRPLPPVAEWRRTIEAVVSREVPTHTGKTYRTAGLAPAEGRVPLLFFHEWGLPIGEWTKFWVEGTEWHGRAVLPPGGCDALVDEEWARLERGGLANVSMQTRSDLFAGDTVLSSQVTEASLIGDRRAGVPGARVTKVYLAPSPPSPEVARALERAQREADEQMAKRWNAGLRADGWRI
jgi:hypothetical protein